MNDESSLDLRALLRERLTPQQLDAGDVVPLRLLRDLLDIEVERVATGEVATVRRGEILETGRRYQEVGELGRGGRGRVSLAQDRNLERAVAIKTLLNPDSVTLSQVRRFVQEALITAQLDHPSIAPVYELGFTRSGDLYYTMKRIEGTALSRVLHDLRHRAPGAVEQYPLGRLLRVLSSVSLTVAYAHDRGVIHRDIKPDNIMIGAYGEVMLLDWGFARVIGESPLVEEPRVLGTPGYLAPERIRGKSHVDPRSDVYSLGCVLYEALALQRVFEASTRRAMLEAAVDHDPVPPSRRALGAPVPEELEVLCLRCLARDPDQRLGSAREVADGLDAFIEGSRRRKEVGTRVKQGRAALQRHLRLRASERRARELTNEIGLRLEPWRPLEEKEALMRGLDRAEKLRESAADAFTEAVACFESALSIDRDDLDARASMADAYWLRFEDAELRNDAREMAVIERWLMTYDDGRYSVRLQGEGAFTLDTNPTHAEVVCLRFERRAQRAIALPFEHFGRTPLQVVALPVGSYLLIVRAPGHRVTRYPLRIRRREHHHPDRPLRLVREDAGVHGFTHIPAGMFTFGGDPGTPGALPAVEIELDDFLIGRYPVTAGEYLEFLQHLQGDDPELAMKRAPRQTGIPGSLWSLRDGQWGLPTADPHGRWWRIEHPVYGVSWEDAAAFCGWRGQRDGVRYDLPTEAQWEKAARGVDARFYPWGRWFDPSFCAMRNSQPGPPIHRPVGAFPLDSSPYGVRDVSGGVQQWCRDWFDEESELRVQRGGAWRLPRRFCRLVHRQGALPWSAGLTTGFRIVREME